jgi:serine/threonine-protein kinase
VALFAGPYALFDPVGSGGMATVHVGHGIGPSTPAGPVAIKRLHPHLNTEPELITMFKDEARIVERVLHPNVARVIDVVDSPEGLCIVMEYIHGESLSLLWRASIAAGELVAIEIAATIACHVLLGLHGAHETTGPDGALLGVVHRDVSPQNVMVGADGVARVLDFGVAKAAGRAQVTRQNQVKGKLAYMAPEQIRGAAERRADVFSASVVFWELLCGQRIHQGCRDVDIVTRVVRGTLPRPSEVRPEVTTELDAVIMRGLEPNPAGRYATALAMAEDVARTTARAPPSAVAAWVWRYAAGSLNDRAQKIHAMMESVAGAR